MKCPYRPITTTTDNSTTIEFAECYGNEGLRMIKSA